MVITPLIRAAIIAATVAATRAVIELAIEQVEKQPGQIDTLVETKWHKT